MQYRYTAKDIGTLGGAQSSANAINNRGEVVGSADIPSTITRSHAFVYSSEDGRILDIGQLVTDAYSVATDINNHGDVVGYTSGAGSFLYSNGQMTQLQGFAYGINDSKHIIVHAASGGHVYVDGLLKRITLSTFPPLYPNSINNSGQIVGVSFAAEFGGNLAFSYKQDSGVTLLSPWGGANSTAYGVNEAGVIVGVTFPSTGSDGFIYRPGGPLQPLGIGNGAIARSINVHGQIVGDHHSPIGGWVYNGIKGELLNTLVDPATSPFASFQTAVDINDRGQIVGTGITKNGKYRAYLLTPLPDVFSDVQIHSAITIDSSQVVADVTVKGAPIEQLKLNVYRLAQPRPNLGVDVPVHSFIASNLPVADHQTITIPVVLGIDTAHPFVVVVADPDNSLAETDENNNAASFKKHTLAIVTHGYCLFNLFPHWVNGMAQDLEAIGYETWSHFWNVESNEKKPGIIELQADLLAKRVRAKMASMDLSENDAIDTHWIGHSRGAALVGIALKNVSSSRETRREFFRGWTKLAMLDPHPARNYSTVPNNNFMDSNGSPFGEMLIRKTYKFQAVTNDPDPYFPFVVDDPVLLFQNSAAETLNSSTGSEQLFNLWGHGVVLYGEDGLPWLGGINLSGSTTGHSEVHNVYLRLLMPAPVSKSTLPTEIAGTASAPRRDAFELYPTFVSNKGVARSLNAKMEQYIRAYDSGNMQAAKGVLNALGNEVLAERGRSIDPEFADMLLWAVNL